ncbi:hypothetical protein VTN96DRAFT_8364 [Rasamsonia emersonii]
MVDQYDRLHAACNAADTYPKNLIRTQAFRHTLQSYRNRLHEQQQLLFDPNPKYTVVDLWEAYDGQDAFHPTSCKTVDALRVHFEVNRKDPRCRHVFIQAEHSRAPLDCSMEMFVYLLSFLQVMARFLDLIFAFGRQWLPKDFHYTAFRHENFLDTLEAKKFEIPKLGRSGREIRHCYNVWSVERSSAGGSPWSIRQTAVYHSFDMDTGRALWINVKGNDLMQKRITEATKTCRRLQAGSLTDLRGSFAATLVTHLILFEWCGENWRSYISSLESDLRKILKKVNNAPIDDVERALAVNPNALIQPLTSMNNTFPSSTPSRANSFSKGHAFSRQSTATDRSFVSNQFMSSKQRVLSGLTATTAGSGTGKQNRQPQLPQSPVSEKSVRPENGEQGDDGDGEDRFGVLQQFSFKELQQLHDIGANLHEASLVMKLNADVLIEVLEHYKTLTEAVGFPAAIKDGCSEGISEFFQRVRSIVRDLKMEQSRIETLMHMLEDGKSLFDGILQFRNMEINKLFAVNAHQSAQRMEEMTRDMHESTIKMEQVTESMHTIAAKTEKDTALMHIITLVTLVFLPGTFVAVRFGLPLYSLRKFTTSLTSNQTIFGSGLFQWDQNHPLEMPVWKPEFFALFAKICFPLMAGTLLIWLGAYWWASWRRGKKQEADEEQLLVDGDEHVQKA